MGRTPRHSSLCWNCLPLVTCPVHGLPRAFIGPPVDQAPHLSQYKALLLALTALRWCDVWILPVLLKLYLRSSPMPCSSIRLYTLLVLICRLASRLSFGYLLLLPVVSQDLTDLLPSILVLLSTGERCDICVRCFCPCCFAA